MTGHRTGRLVAIKQAGRDRQKRVIWRCKCDCGSYKDVPSRHLVNAAVRSCGCFGKEVWARNGKRGGVKLRGAQSHLYKADLTAEHRLVGRNVPALREWRKEVFERDGYKCGICGQVGHKINAHHLNCWAEHPTQRYNLSNGITLCAKHHKEFHDSMGGPRKPCTKDDYDRFKAQWYLAREIARLRDLNG